MKKTIRTILYAAVFAVLAVSCQKEINGVEPKTGNKETIEISINGLMGEYTQVDATKSELVNTVRVSWKGGETVYVYDGTQCLGSLVASLEGDEDRYALLSTDASHTVSTPASGTTKLTLVHSPLLTEAPAVSEGAISISLASQASTKAPFVAYATLDYTSTAITDALVPFKFATSVIKVNCSGLKANTAIDNATLNNVNTACKLTLSGTGEPTVSGDVNGIITKTGDTYFAAEKVNTEGEAVFQIAVPALETVSEPRYLTVVQGSLKKQDKKFTTKSLDAAISVNAVCQLAGPPVGGLFGELSVGNNKKVYFSKGNLYYNYTSDKYYLEENQYIGTGLAFWCANKGSAFLNTYNSLNTDTQKDILFTNDGSVSSKEDFTINVGGEEQKGWRTLSYAEWLYLFNTRTVNGGTGNGKSYSLNITYGENMGLVLYPDDYTGEPLSGTVTVLPEGVVFLPAAGYRDNNGAYDLGVSGNYWASSTAESNYGDGLQFTSDRVSFNSQRRGKGSSIRLVTDVK